ncbi:hypothetical protein [Pelosinus sp. IPA-1]|uniref:hypothetical protein n=1 Tax=Pelosinus sp. IPA-1 TaxID=3029569 RepID=UPI0024361D73|nr:hypothetical protein [Pelosinus sp. IPA-1]GMB02236.1 hypothetical protein PIPA1_50370 [Pelosinus sp. IPA-1]
METMSALIRQEDLSFSSKTKIINVKSIDSMAVDIVDIRKMHRNNKEMRMVSLERKRAKKEAEVVTIVENYLNLITKNLKDLFEKNKINITSYAAEIVNRKKKVDHKEIFQQVLPITELEQLQMDIKHEIQQEIHTLFGVKSLEIASIKSNVDKLIPHQHKKDIDILLSEYRRAVFVAEHMTTVANKLWDQCLDTFKLPPMATKVAKKFELGSIFMKTVNCRPKDQLRSCQREIEKQLTGVMINIENRINQDMRNTTTKVFYELYEQTIAPCFEKRLALLVTKDNSKAVVIREKTPLHLLKQANVSL